MLYDQIVPAARNALQSLSAQLAKGLAWGADNNVGELQLIASRLAPDMFPLATQVRFSCAQAIQPMTRLGAGAGPEFPDDATDFAGLYAQIDQTLAFLDGIAPEALGDDGDRAIDFALPNGMVFDLTAATYVRDWALPQFYFHIVTAYGVLRHMGVPLGKADYASYMMPYIRPGTFPPA